MTRASNDERCNEAWQGYLREHADRIGREWDEYLHRHEQKRSWAPHKERVLRKRFWEREEQRFKSRWRRAELRKERGIAPHACWGLLGLSALIFTLYVAILGAPIESWWDVPLGFVFAAFLACVVYGLIACVVSLAASALGSDSALMDWAYRKGWWV
ncbi:MAG TPA: hypothetical protein VGF25_12550 [Thermoleophilaceae bacterium]